MNNWETHQVKFMPSEGLEKNETSVRVLDHDLPEDERVEAMQDRAQMISDNSNNIESLRERQKLSEKIKSDPGYKFLMMVAAFSSQKINTLTSSEPVKTVSENAVGFDFDNEDGTQWLHIPEVSGLVHISSEVYGHIKESQTILSNGFTRMPLKQLIENCCYMELFARLVSLRMNLSDCLASKRAHLDKTYERLHREQTFVCQALRNRTRNYREHDWSRPYYSQ